MMMFVLLGWYGTMHANDMSTASIHMRLDWYLLMIPFWQKQIYF